MNPSQDFVSFEGDGFAAHLPAGYLYTLNHFWLAESEPELWRVGLTHFATRTLGEVVEFDFEAVPGSAVHSGQRIGWIEGFKAISDLYCVVEGHFIQVNSAALDQPELICGDPYGMGWLYEARGHVVPPAIDVHTYIAHLKQTLDDPQTQV